MAIPLLSASGRGLVAAGCQPTRRGVTAPAGTRPRHRPLSRGELAMAGSRQRMHSLEVPGIRESIILLGEGTPQAAIPKLPARQIIYEQSHPATGGKRLCQREGAGFPSALTPSPGMGTGTASPRPSCTEGCTTSAALPASEVKPRALQGTHWHFYLGLGPSTS